MKFLLTMLALIFFVSTIRSQFKRDTLYFNKSNNFIHVIFKDSTHTNFHKKVLDIFSFEKNGGLTIDSSHIHKEKLKYFGNWVTVFKFKKRYYAYSPSEAYFNTFLTITDSSLILNDFNDGFVTYKISNQFSKSKMIKFYLLGENDKKYFLSICKKGKTLFEMRSSLFNVKKMYFVNKHDYLNYPIIVNYCPDNRCNEFDFK